MNSLVRTILVWRLLQNAFPLIMQCAFLQKQWRTVAQKNTLYEAFAQTIHLNLIIFLRCFCKIF